MTHTLSIYVLLASFLILTACDSTFVDPFEGQERYFSVYGILQTTETEHYIRVVPIRRSIEDIIEPRDTQAKIDASVTSVDLQTGTKTTWAHHLLRLADGKYGHVFSASFMVSPGHTYRLEIKRTSGATTVAETTIPHPGSISISQELPQLISDSLYQTITIENMSWPNRIDIVYEVGFGLGMDFRRVFYGRSGQRTEHGWQLDINLTGDASYLKELLGIPDDQLLPLASIDARLEIPDAGWIPVYDTWTTPEDWDLAVLAQPEQLSNVQNGYGFWGSISVSNPQSWMITEEAARQAGFLYKPSGANKSVHF